MYFRRFVTFILAFIVFAMSLFGLTTGMAAADEVCLLYTSPSPRD